MEEAKKMMGASFTVDKKTYDVDEKVEETVFELKNSKNPESKTVLVNFNTPECSCYTWIKNKLACRHMLFLFDGGYASWENFPDWYKSSPFFNADIEEVNDQVIIYEFIKITCIPVGKLFEVLEIFMVI